MKNNIKRILLALLAVAAVAGMTACAKEESGGRDERAGHSDIEDDATEDDEDTTGESGDDSENPGTQEQYLYQYKTLIDTDNMTALFLDDNDSVVYDASYGEFIKEHGLDEYISPISDGVENLYFRQYGDDGYGYLYRFNVATGVWQDVSDGKSYDFVDVIGDKLYFVSDDVVYDSELSASHDYSERAYTVTEDGSLKPADGYDAFYQALDESWSLICGLDNTYGLLQYYSPAYCFARGENVPVKIGEKGNNYALLDENGNIVSEFEIETDEYGLMVDGWSGDYIVYHTFDDEYVLNGHYVYDICENESKPVTWGDDTHRYALAILDDNFYYAVYESNTEETSYTVTAYDMSGDTYCEIQKCVDYPGQSIYTPGVSGFGAFDDECWYIIETDTGAYWRGALASESDYSFRDIDRVLYEPSFVSFGTIDTVRNQLYCDDCDRVHYSYYSEIFRLDDRYEHSTEINELLDEYEASNYEWGWTQVEEGMRDFDTHADSYCYYENRLDDVKLIGNHYITVDYGTYEYLGGAHGYPYREHILFDLSTGDLTEFTDICNLSEEEFKTIVAEKTVEDCEGYSDIMNPYYLYTDLDELYDAAYEAASLENSIITYETDGILVSYSPYEFGPYSSGYIDVEISYSDLGIVAFDN